MSLSISDWPLSCEWRLSVTSPRLCPPLRSSWSLWSSGSGCSVERQTFNTKDKDLQYIWLHAKNTFKFLSLLCVCVETLSISFCSQGKEKVKPRGRVCPFRFWETRKSLRQAAMWSNNWTERERQIFIIIPRQFFLCINVVVMLHSSDSPVLQVPASFPLGWHRSDCPSSALSAPPPSRGREAPGSSFHRDPAPGSRLSLPGGRKRIGWLVDRGAYCRWMCFLSAWMHLYVHLNLSNKVQILI